MTSTLGNDVDLLGSATEGELPLFVTPANPKLKDDLDASVDWLKSVTGELSQVLSRVGAVVLRGFPVKDTADFNRMVEHLPSPDFDYAGGVAKRNALGGKVFETTTAIITDVVLPLHQEMAYQPTYPTKLTFFCQVAPDRGGSTTIGDVRKIASTVPSTFRDEVRERGVMYRRHMRSPDSVAVDEAESSIWHETRHKTWVETFYTESQAEVEEICRATGLEFEWLPDGSLKTECRTPGYAPHPLTGETHWFNHIHPMGSPLGAFGEEYWKRYSDYYLHPNPRYGRPNEVLFGDGGAMDLDTVLSLYPLYAEHTVAFPWQPGDLMFVDNMITAHGRSPYTGPRNIQVSLSTGW